MESLSLILPVYNEEGNLKRLLEELLAMLRSVHRQAEIIVVDDASTDGSGRVASGFAAAHARVRVVVHSHNCGQSAAFASGFAAAEGALIVTMDADGQHDPADVPLLLAALKPGVDAVCGFRKKRLDSWTRRASSAIANGFRNLITGDRISDAGCTLRIVRREALAEIPRFNGMHRFLPTLLRYQGFTVAEVAVSHRPRLWGVSKYGIRNRLLRGVVDCFAMRWWKRRALPCRRLAQQG
jgi:glycosyltransferase involved in cell wall biosynthesis